MTRPAFEVHAARGWLRAGAVIVLVLGVLVSLLVLWALRIGIDLFDGRLISVLMLIAPPMLLGGGLLLWRMAGWKIWLLRIDENGIGVRSCDAFGRLKEPQHIPWDGFARAEFASGPKGAQALELRDTEARVYKPAMTQLSASFPEIIERLQDGLGEAGVPFRTSGRDVIAFDRVVIERLDGA